MVEVNELLSIRANVATGYSIIFIHFGVDVIREVILVHRVLAVSRMELGSRSELWLELAIWIKCGHFDVEWIFWCGQSLME